MPIRRTRRLAAPLLVLAGAALFGIGAGGIAGVDARLEATVQPPVQTPTQQPPLARDEYRGVRRHTHGGAL